MPRENIAIKVEDLWFKYPESDQWALRGVNLEIEEGAMLAIMGENGAGKTTLIKHFNGLLKPTKGRVLVLGMDTREHTVAELARYVGLVFQNPDHQIFAETVLDEILFAPRNMGWDMEEAVRRARQIMEEFGLLRYERTSPFMLSGGERKRLAIASVLVYDPQIIVMDEPTTGQDYKQKMTLARIIRSLADRGKTVIVVTHDVEFVAENFDEIVIMSEGRILARGPAARLLRDRELLKRARLIMPQLAEAADLLWDKVPFDDDYLRVEGFVRAVRRWLTDAG